MSAVEKPMTVAELITRLQTFDREAVVMVECEDNYYSNPLSQEYIEEGTAARFAAFDWMSPSEDEYGKPVFKPTKNHQPESWEVLIEGLNYRSEVLERLPCVIIRAVLGSC